MGCKQRNSTVSKTAPTISEKASPGKEFQKWSWNDRIQGVEDEVGEPIGTVAATTDEQLNLDLLFLLHNNEAGDTSRYEAKCDHHDQGQDNSNANPFIISLLLTYYVLMLPLKLGRLGGQGQHTYVRGNNI